MKILKTFETWNDNNIDKSLFVSGRAKYSPKISNNKIAYKTGTSEPYYFAEITKKGEKFICKVYKRKKDGTEIRIKNKIKRTLKTAHNYVREFLNQRLKKKKKKKEKEKDVDMEIINKRKEEILGPEIQMEPEPFLEPPKPMIPTHITKPRSRAIIHRF